MSTPDKATIYIDIDDEITSIIDKLASSKERIVALVLPKRAAVLQSVVNMKLLKRAADEQKKRIVLITSETALLPLAGAAGLHVAKNLQSRPMIPTGGATTDDATEELTDGDSVSFNGAPTDDEPVDFDAEAAAGTTIGALAGGGAAMAADHAGDDVETIELDDNDAAGAGTSGDAATGNKKADKKAKKDKKNKKLAVPNFNRFRLVLMLGGLGLVLLVVFIYLAVAVLPKANVIVTTDTSDIKTNATLTLDPKATAADNTTGTIPANFVQKQQSASQQVPATGQQNNGQSAHGSATITLTNCNNSDPITIPAGTGLSTNGLTYITQSDVTLSSIKVNNKCNPPAFSNLYSQSVNVVAQKAGTQYNVGGGTKLSVATGAGYSSSDVSSSASGDINGGTDNIVKIIAQADLDSAQAKLATQDSTATKSALTTQLQQAGFQPIDATFTGGAPSSSPSAAVGTPSDTVTVTQVITYSMYGVKNSDIKNFLTAAVTKQIDPTKQTITDDGVATAAYKVTSASPEQVSISATSVAGPDIKVATIQKQVGGMKAGEISSLLKQDPGVIDVKVKMSPFWVTSAPKKTSKVTVTFVKSSSSNGSKP